MVASVAVVAEEQLVIVLRSAAERAGLALDTLPRVLAHTQHHVLGELQTGRMACSATNRARYQLLW